MPRGVCSGDSTSPWSTQQERKVPAAAPPGSSLTPLDPHCTPFWVGSSAGPVYEVRSGQAAHLACGRRQGLDSEPQGPGPLKGTPGTRLTRSAPGPSVSTVPTLLLGLHSNHLGAGHHPQEAPRLRPRTSRLSSCHHGGGSGHRRALWPRQGRGQPFALSSSTPTGRCPFRPMRQPSIPSQPGNVVTRYRGWRGGDHPLETKNPGKPQPGKGGTCRRRQGTKQLGDIHGHRAASQMGKLRTDPSRCQRGPENFRGALLRGEGASRLPAHPVPPAGAIPWPWP